MTRSAKAVYFLECLSCSLEASQYWPNVCEISYAVLLCCILYRSCFGFIVINISDGTGQFFPVKLRGSSVGDHQLVSDEISKEGWII